LGRPLECHTGLRHWKL